MSDFYIRHVEDPKFQFEFGSLLVPFVSFKVSRP